MHVETYKQILTTLSVNNKYRMHGNGVASYETQAKRREIIFRFMKDLHRQGYKLRYVRNLKPRHIRIVIRHWEDQGIKDLQTRISVIRAFCIWIGKEGLMPDPKTLVDNPQSLRRPLVADYDHTWSGAGIDIDAKLAEIETLDPRVATVLQLMLAFGLRLKEALLLRPMIADRGNHIHISCGAKGGRERMVSIRKTSQRDILQLAKTVIDTRSSSLIPDDREFNPYRKRVYKICNRAAIGMRNGVNVHGLRHEYANRLYQEITGHPSPIKNNGIIAAPEDMDQQARMTIAFDLGHNRPSIASAYIGGMRLSKQDQAESLQ